jgi:hypothetical protein
LGGLHHHYVRIQVFGTHHGRFRHRPDHESRSGFHAWLNRSPSARSPVTKRLASG